MFVVDRDAADAVLPGDQASFDFGAVERRPADPDAGAPVEVGRVGGQGTDRPAESGDQFFFFSPPVRFERPMSPCPSAVQ